MKLWAAVLLLALGVNANVGPSGIVSPDGKNIQFSHEFASNIVLIGPSGIVTRDGINLQLTEGQARLNSLSIPVAPVGQFVAQRGIIGPAGIVRPDGRNTQFTQAQVDNFVLRGPSGIVTKDGRNIQFTDDLQFLNRKKRNVGFVSTRGNIGTSGILRADGTTDLFDHDTAHNIVLIGPSGVVTKDGRNFQLTDDLRIVGRTKRNVGFVSTRGNIGTSGILRADGTTDLFDHDTAHNIVLIGPSGVVTKDGRNFQLTDDLRIVGRTKRNVGFVSTRGNIGTSGILRADGTTDLFDHDTAHNIVLIGPSGVVTKDGRNFQLTDDLRIVGRTKRALPLIGPSGLITAQGQPVQFKEANAQIILEGPSGIILSDGTLVQKWN